MNHVFSLFLASGLLGRLVTFLNFRAAVLLLSVRAALTAPRFNRGESSDAGAMGELKWRPRLSVRTVA